MSEEASLAKQLGEAVAKLPGEEYVVLRREDRDEGDVDNPYPVFLSMVLMRSAPKDGWKTEGDYFGHPPDSASHKKPCRESWKHEPRCLFGVSGDPAHPKAFIRNVVAALQRHLGKEAT